MAIDPPSNLPDAEPLDTVPPEFDQELNEGTLPPPKTLGGILRQLGPGLVVAGSIVGSGELIATTKTGAQAGIALLWLIVVGCLIKVFVQIELGRYSICNGETTLNALNRVPGRMGPANWIIWFWFFMMLAGIAQLGGIVGGVGQSLAIAVPFTGDYREAIAVPEQSEVVSYLEWTDLLNSETVELTDIPEEELTRIQHGHKRIGEALEQLGERGVQTLEAVKAGETLKDPRTWDDKFWALIVGLITVALLYNGRYSVIQTISTVLVIAFTFITIGNVVSLQMTEEWALSWDDVVTGFSFGLPKTGDKWDSLATALATFGIIGVGATELITYPYWCIEKGYARYTGKRTNDEDWVTRARGWMKVMHYDAFLSMVVYTIATMAFFIMGVAVLYREGRDPGGMRMVSTLASAYVPVFGTYAKWLFLGGAIAVLYSTFLVANAGHSRMYTDAMKIFGFIPRNDQKAHDRTLTTFCVVLPILCVALHWTGIDPASAVLLSGMMQATMLPMIGLGALYFRYTSTDPRLAPSKLWDVMLIISFLGLLVAGVWGVYLQILKLM
ncbi:manganese transport protein MntH [Thalassoglobus neptunius]|uniref:Manganese transport protein MntH n=1 Tax=Thalassoglobus neptunius TaxID=1938619 RepID=A0A5C5X9F7_9PLAN|nr:Nramp family divalent metal transporter [Thalassoglobus neptunius]TWT58785.1 manganese transport protein MntH [Thalassoglobus neptunius]